MTLTIYNTLTREKEPFVPIDPSHAFYLGYELAKATTALTLGKQYRQDQALQWGFLTVPERSVHDRRRDQQLRKRSGISCIPNHGLPTYRCRKHCGQPNDLLQYSTFSINRGCTNRW